MSKVIFTRGIPGKTGSSPTPLEKDGGLNGGTILDSHIRVTVGLLAVKGGEDQFDDLWDAGGTANENDFVGLVHLEVTKDLLDRLRNAAGKCVRVEKVYESIWSKRESISKGVWGTEERVRVARSQAVRRRRRAQVLVERSNNNMSVSKKLSYKVTTYQCSPAA